jgi:hypothetical protein
LGADAWGGALDNYQTMTIANCLFTGNSAVGGPMAHAKFQGQAILTGDELITGATGVILTISNSTNEGNQAIGGSGGSTLGNADSVDVAFGGGIANGFGGTLNVAGCTITGNQAIGGASAKGNGAMALGGGIENNHDCTLNRTDSTVSTNLCQGGAGASGSAGGLASGGGLDNSDGAITILTTSIISLNDSGVPAARAPMAALRWAAASAMRFTRWLSAASPTHPR